MQIYLNICVKLRLLCQKCNLFSCSYHKTDTNIISHVLECSHLFKADADQMCDLKLFIRFTNQSIMNMATEFLFTYNPLYLPFGRATTYQLTPTFYWCSWLFFSIKPCTYSWWITFYLFQLMSTLYRSHVIWHVPLHKACCSFTEINYIGLTFSPPKFRVLKPQPSSPILQECILNILQELHQTQQISKHPTYVSTLYPAFAFSPIPLLLVLIVQDAHSIADLLKCSCVLKIH